jgi:hypothetical protein
LANAAAILGEQSNSLKTRMGNTVIIDDNGDGLQSNRFAMTWTYGSTGDGVFTYAYEATDDYVYDAGDYKKAYTRAGALGSATKLTRQVIYLRPDFVIVHDRVGTVKDAYPKILQWNFSSVPAVSGNSFVVAKGSSKLFGQTFSSQGLTTSIGNPFSANVHTVRTQNANLTTDVQYTTAFQTAPSSTSSMVATTRVASGDGRMEGVQMAEYVVMFGTDGAVDLSTGSINYNFSGSVGVKHLLTDLSPGASYQIKIDGVVLGTFTASDQGTITFDTAAGAGSVLVLKGSDALTANPDTYSVRHDQSLRAQERLLADRQSDDRPTRERGIARDGDTE